MINRFIFILAAALGTQPLFGETPKISNGSSFLDIKKSGIVWKRCSSAEGLSLYWSKVEGSQVIAFRGEGIVDAPIEKVASILLDTNRNTEWVDSLVSSKIVRTLSPTEFIEYDHAGIPFPFDTLTADRDFVSHVTLGSDPVHRRLVITYEPAEDQLAPLLKKYVRGSLNCEFRIVPMSLEEETYVEAEIYCDPKGGVPKWMVNFFQQGWPQKTFERLRKQVKKQDIQILPVVEQLLQKPAVNLVKKSR